MTHCNDQLIDQLLTQAEQEGRCLIPPSTAIRKALLRRTGGTVVSPMPGLFARKTRWDELNRAQRHCEIIRALAIIHPDWTFCSFSAACLLGLVATPERRACLQLDKAVGSSGRTYSAAPD